MNSVFGQRTLGALGLSLALHLAVILAIALAARPLPKEDRSVLVELLVEPPIAAAEAPVVLDPAAPPRSALAEAVAAPPRLTTPPPVAADVPPPLPPRVKPQAEAPPQPPAPMDTPPLADVVAASPAEAPPVPAAPATAVAQPAALPSTGAAPARNPAGNSYATALLRWLERYREYPRAARLRRIEGVVVLRLTIDRSGGLAEARVAESSGSPLLDDAALNMARRAAPLPPLPQGEGVERVVMLVPITFRLG